MKEDKIIVVITDISLRPSCYQWFMYGMMLMEHHGKINLKWKVSFMDRMLLHKSMLVPYRIINKIKRIILPPRGERKDKNILRGYVLSEGRKYTFCIDSADAPFLFVGQALRDYDIYFKMQCPKEFLKEGFPIGKIYAPYIDVEFVNPSDYGNFKGERKPCKEVFEYIDKIKPLMVGPRMLSMSCSFESLDAGYKNLLSSRSVQQTKKAMCYFGDSRGPKPTENLDKIDWDWESDIMAKFINELNHPNEKRAKIADIMEALGDDYDARVINRGNADSGVKKDSNLVVPLKDFSKHVAQFAYNINISGYRMSIPNRFIDSFVGGTAIATDNLYVKWYAPFGEEVVELGDMGYLQDKDVDFASIALKIKNLEVIDKQQVIKKYEKYWAPEKVAEYMIKTICNP